jgi:hypothetical protein
MDIPKRATAVLIEKREVFAVLREALVGIAGSCALLLAVAPAILQMKSVECLRKMGIP